MWDEQRTGHPEEQNVSRLKKNYDFLDLALEFLSWFQLVFVVFGVVFRKSYAKKLRSFLLCPLSLVDAYDLQPAPEARDNSLRNDLFSNDTSWSETGGGGEWGGMRKDPKIHSQFEVIFFGCSHYIYWLLAKTRIQLLLVGLTMEYNTKKYLNISILQKEASGMAHQMWHFGDISGQNSEEQNFAKFD